MSSAKQATTDAFTSSKKYEPPAACDAVIASPEQTKYQPVSSLAKNTGFSPDEILRSLEALIDTVTSAQVGAITVYFLKKNAPEGNLYNSGKGFCVQKNGNGKNAAALTNTRRGHAAPTQDKLDLEIIERFARQGKTHKQLAAALDIPLRSVSFYLSSKKYPQYGEAWRKGKSAAKRARLPESKIISETEIIFPFTLENTEIDALVSSIAV